MDKLLVAFVSSLSVWQKILGVLGIIALAVASWYGAVALHDYNVRQDLIQKINTDSQESRDAELKNAQEVKDNLNRKSDCDKLDSVYGDAGGCEKRKDPPKEDVPKTLLTKSADTLGDGQDGAEDSGAVVPVGEVLQSKEADKSVPCYPTEDLDNPGKYIVVCDDEPEEPANDR